MPTGRRGRPNRVHGAKASGGSRAPVDSKQSAPSHSTHAPGSANGGRFCPESAILFSDLHESWCQRDPPALCHRRRTTTLAVAPSTASDPAIPTGPPRAMSDPGTVEAVSYTHLRAHETRHDLVC